MKNNLEKSKTREKAWIYQIHVMYAALIAVGIVMVQPFLFHGQLVGTSAKVCVVAFSLAIPMLSALLLLNYEEDFRVHMSHSKTVAATKGLAVLTAFIGITAGFWHMNELSGIGILVGSAIGLVAYAFGYEVLYRERRSKT